MIKAKPLLKDKFWIVEENGARIGTISRSEERFMLTKSNQRVEFFDSEGQLKDKLGNVYWDYLPEEKHDMHVNGYSCSVVPYNKVYDIKRQLPLFTKSEKSKSLYCAGYYIIKFEQRWAKAFCPKLITLDRYDFKGPWKTESKMKEELSIANRTD
jgi:hypothetical protein